MVSVPKRGTGVRVQDPAERGQTKEKKKDRGQCYSFFLFIFLQSIKIALAYTEGDRAFGSATTCLRSLGQQNHYHLHILNHILQRTFIDFLLCGDAILFCFFAIILFLASFFIFYVVPPPSTLFILWLCCLLDLIVKALSKLWLKKCCIFKFSIIITVGFFKERGDSKPSWVWTNSFKIQLKPWGLHLLEFTNAGLELEHCQFESNEENCVEKDLKPLLLLSKAQGRWDFKMDEYEAGQA